MCTGIFFLSAKLVSTLKVLNKSKYYDNTAGKVQRHSVRQVRVQLLEQPNKQQRNPREDATQIYKRMKHTANINWKELRKANIIEKI